MPLPLDIRKKPADVKIHLSSGAGVDITWSDGHSSHFDFAYLREECPCAACKDERDKKEAFGAPAPSAVLPIFKPKPKAATVVPVGNYAIQIFFSDGHSSGIYSYEYLRSVCPCAECASAFRSAAP